MTLNDDDVEDPCMSTCIYIHKASLVYAIFRKTSMLHERFLFSIRLCKNHYPVLKMLWLFLLLFSTPACTGRDILDSSFSDVLQQLKDNVLGAKKMQVRVTNL